MAEARLLLLNVLYLALGVGVLCFFRGAASWRQLGARLGLAYMGGIAVAGILGAELALAGVVLSWGIVAAAASLSLFLGGRRFLRGRIAHASTGEALGGRLIGGAALVQTGLLLGVAGTAFAVRPLIEWDGWAIWGLRAHALYSLGGVSNPVFESPLYATHHQEYPLLLPALEAAAFRALGSADLVLVHVQLLLLAVGFAGALWSLLRPRVPAEVAGLSLLALMAAPPVLVALSSNYADVPLAFFVSLGVVALARWLLEPDSRLLPWAALFLAAGALTKGEGLMFGFAALAVLAVVVRRRALPLLPVAGVIIAAVVPWRVFLATHGIHEQDFSLGTAAHPGYLAHNADRLWPALQAMGHFVGIGRFGLLVPLAAAAVVAALTARRYALVAFAVGWVALGLAGLELVYWISPLPLHWYLSNSADRTILTLVIGAASLAPLLAGDAWRETLAAWRAREKAVESPLPAEA